MKIVKLMSVVILSSVIASCAMPRPSSGPGFLFTSVKEGVFADNNVSGSKTGEACNSNVLGIVVSGDQSIEAAKRYAGVKNISTIDRSYFGVLGLYAQACTIVKGN